VAAGTRAPGARAIAWETVRLFDMPNGYDFAVAPDGESSFYTAPNPAEPAHEIRVVLNWLQELYRTGVR
jgi:hypothetical protein